MENENNTNKEKSPVLMEGSAIRAGFPMFIKLLIAFFIFGILPFLITSLLFLWNYDAALKALTVTFLEEGAQQAVSHIKEINQTVRIQMGILSLFFFAAAFIGILFSARIIVSPLGALLEVMRKLARGQYGTEVKLKSNDEFAIFADYFNQMSRQLKMTVEREQAISQIKSEFISLAAHQLRTPLSAMKWALRMVIDGDMGKINRKQRDFLEKSYQTNERMIGLINDLLDVARIEEGKFGYIFDFSDLGTIIESVIGEQNISAQRKNIKIIFRQPAKMFPKIKIDSSKIKVALGNLLENAILYTLPGGLVEISIETFGKNYLKVVIKDTGVGIPKHQIPRLFSKFFRGGNVVLMQTEGSGLGLFIVKNIIQRHGGKIWLESEEGKGTTVHFTLPLEEKLIPEKEKAFEGFIIGF